MKLSQETGIGIALGVKGQETGLFIIEIRPGWGLGLYLPSHRWAGILFLAGVPAPLGLFPEPVREPLGRAGGRHPPWAISGLPIRCSG